MVEDVVKDSVLSLFNSSQTGFEYVLSQIVYVAVAITIVIGCVCLSIFIIKKILSQLKRSK
jgi:hypothetical protein